MCKFRLVIKIYRANGFVVRTKLYRRRTNTTGRSGDYDITFTFGWSGSCNYLIR